MKVSSGSVLVALLLVGCATTAAVGDAELSPEPVVDPAHPSLPAPSSPGSSSPDGTSATTDAGKDSGKGGGGTTNKDGGGGAATTVDAAPPPPPPQICINEAGAPLAVQTECGCNKDCAAGLVCAQVGGLVQPWCCAAGGKACNDDNDCCGQLLCVSGTCK